MICTHMWIYFIIFNSWTLRWLSILIYKHTMIKDLAILDEFLKNFFSVIMLSNNKCKLEEQTMLDYPQRVGGAHCGRLEAP